ncbi:MAG: TraR/DksA family transcriptional regulator [Pseudomonadota bacterium]
MNTDLEQDHLAGLDDGNDAQRVDDHRKNCGGRSDAASLERIERALDRIKTGDYGYCVGCGDPLSLVTLETDPAADLCRRCA